jgi:hypothetical protein
MAIKVRPNRQVDVLPTLQVAGHPEIDSWHSAY